MVSGTLVFDIPNAGDNGAVLFDKGMPSKTSAATPHCRLSDLLVEHGWLDASSAEQTYAMALEQHAMHGQLLLECQLVDEAGLSNLLQSQMLRRLEWLASRPGSTVLTLHPGIDLLGNVPRVPAPSTALGLIWSLAKALGNDRDRERVLTRLDGHVLRLDPTSDLDVFGFNRNERLIVQRLHASPTRLSTLLMDPPLPVTVVEALVYVLVLTRRIILEAKPAGVVAPSSSHPESSGEYSATNRNLSTDLDVTTDNGSRRSRQATGSIAQLKAELQAFAARADVLDYYTLLGLPRDAEATALRMAFSNLCRRYHPDELPKELASLRPVAERVQARLVAAYRVLADNQSRARYDRETPPPSSGTSRERAAKRSLGAEALRRAELWLKRDRLELAEAEAARAVAFAPTDSRCIALYAWIRALKPGCQDELGAILEALTQALDLDPMDVQTRFYRSQLLKRLERLDEAVAEWRLIIEIQPNHIDSLRELRLWEMRQGSTRPPKRLESGTQPQVSLNPPPPGLFGRLFRNKR